MIEPMKIKSLSAKPVSVPSVRPCAWSWGTGIGCTRTIVQLETDGGLIGLGECEGAIPAAMLNGGAGKKLIGLSVHDLAAIRRIFRMDFRDYLSLASVDLVQAFAAVEMAIWDLRGKEAGVPVYQLLGGAARGSAPFVAYGYSFPVEKTGLAEKDIPNTMAKFAAESVSRTGAGIFEFKVGRYSLDTDIETVLAVREAVDEKVMLAIDANMSLEVDRARRFLGAVERACLGWFEEPVASFADMTRLRNESAVPLSTHCLDLEKLVHYPAVEGVVGDLHLQGGLSGLMNQAATFRAAGRRFWLRSCTELGISWAAMVHLGMACPDIDRASQCLIEYVEDDLVVGNTWLVRDGGVTAPDTPGLGVELDQPALNHYQEIFEKSGEFTHFDFP